MAVPRRARDIIITSLVMAFTIAAGLTWKDAFLHAVQEFAPQPSTVLAEIFIAILLTALVVIAVYILIVIEKFEAKLERKLRKR